VIDLCDRPTPNGSKIRIGRILFDQQPARAK